MLPRHHFGFSRTSRSVMQTWWSCGNQTQSPANHFYRSRVLHVIVFTSLYVLRLAEAFWESTANTVQQMCLWLLPLWVILLNQQELQLIQQSVGSTLPMTQSVRSWGGSVFPLLLKRTAIGIKRPKTPSRVWHLFFQSASAAQRSMVGSISL